MRGGVAHAVDLDRARPREPAGAAQQVDTRAREPAFLARVGIVRDHEVTPREDRVDVDLRARRGLARVVRRFTGSQQRLGRDARPVGALAPDQFALDERDPQPALGQFPGTVLSGRAAPEDDHVVVRLHSTPLIRGFDLFVHRPGARWFTSCKNQPLPSGSLNWANEP